MIPIRAHTSIQHGQSLPMDFSNVTTEYCGNSLYNTPGANVAEILIYKTAKETLTSAGAHHADNMSRHQTYGVKKSVSVSIALIESALGKPISYKERK